MVHIIATIIATCIFVAPFALLAFLIWLLIRIGKKRKALEVSQAPQRPRLGRAGWLDVIVAVGITIIFATVFANWAVSHRELAQQTQYIVIPMLLYVLLMFFFLSYRATRRAEKKGMIPSAELPKNRNSLKTLAIVMIAAFLFMGIALIFPPPVAQWLAAAHIPTPSWLVWVILPVMVLWAPIYGKLRPAKTTPSPAAPRKLSRSLVSIACALIVGTVIGQILLAPNTNQKQCDDPSNLDGLINACTAIIESGEAKAGQYNNRGVGYAKKGQYDQALQDYNQALSMEPDNAIILTSRGNLYVAKEQYDLAIEDLNRAIRINPGYANAFLIRSLVYINKGLDDEAISDLTQVIRLAPNSFPAFLGRGQLNFSVGQFMKAIEDLDQANRLKPGDADVFFSRGLAKFYGISPTAAMSDLAAAVQADPSDGYKVLWLHLAHMRKGENDTPEFERNSASLVAGKWPTPVIAFYRGKSTAETLMKATAGNPATQQEQICEANFYIGALYLQTSRKDDAKRFFQAADTGCPKNFTEKTAAHTELKALGP
jgi:lipoprotein NlpI